MHDIKWIRDNPDAFDRALARRGLPGEAKRLIELDERRRAAILKVEQAQARRNAASKDIGQAKAKKDEAAAAKLMAEVAELKNSISAMEADEKKLSRELDAALAQIPNLPLDEVPDGTDEHGNVERHKFGAKREYKNEKGEPFTPKQHFELGEALGMMDFETAAKLSGARFVILKNGLARLERALGQFMLDLHTTEHGYTEVNPPILVRDEVMFGTGQLPKFREDQFSTSMPINTVLDEFLERFIKSQIDHKARLEKERVREEEIKESLDRRRRAATGNMRLLDIGHSDTVDVERFTPAAPFWLIPTAEVPLTNLVRESIVEENALPMRFTACTPCFRAEAGAAGKDTRGMIRQHQFTKVELVSITTPEKSRDEHERMLSCAEEVLRRLDLHYRVVTLCTGDMGFASQKTYDIEVWLPGQNLFREISSCSVCGEFQARRMAARYRGKDGKVKGHVHTLNGSGVAVGRALIAVMETYQQADGSIVVPDALAPYMGGIKKIERVK